MNDAIRHHVNAGKLLKMELFSDKIGTVEKGISSADLDLTKSTFLEVNMAKASLPNNFSANNSAQDEGWRTHPRFTEIEVSNLGRIRSETHPVGYTLYVKPNGYRYIDLRSQAVAPYRSRMFYVHHLVAECFLGARPAWYEVNHKDRNKDNNRPNNLEYVTHLENMLHYRSSFPDWVLDARERFGRGETIASIAKSTGKNRRTVSRAVNGRTWAKESYDSELEC